MYHRSSLHIKENNQKRPAYQTDEVMTVSLIAQCTISFNTPVLGTIENNDIKSIPLR